MVSAPKRFAILLLRSWRQNIRNSKVIIIRLAAVIVQAFLFASIFKSVGHGKSGPKSIADRVSLLTYGDKSLYDGSNEDVGSFCHGAKRRNA